MLDKNCKVNASLSLQLEDDGNSLTCDLTVTTLPRLGMDTLKSLSLRWEITPDSQSCSANEIGLGLSLQIGTMRLYLRPDLAKEAFSKELGCSPRRLIECFGSLLADCSSAFPSNSKSEPTSEQPNPSTPSKQSSGTLSE